MITLLEIPVSSSIISLTETPSIISKTTLESEIALLHGRIREQENASSRLSLYDEPQVIGREVDEAENIPPVELDNEGETLDSGAENDDQFTEKASSRVTEATSLMAETTTEHQPSEASAGIGRKKNIFAGLKNDNLQIVEGIGPKMNEVLSEHGVRTWEDLGDKTNEELRAILDKANAKRYRIIDPSSWPQQAKLASQGEWEKLIILQKNLDSGRAAGATGETDSKVEKLLIKMGVLKRWKQDDLTAIEGIGPKISGLLKDAGIDSWRELANAKVDRIQSILDAAGKRYRLADPSSWPKQAEMAADGRWDDLEEYQDFLQGGK